MNPVRSLARPLNVDESCRDLGGTTSNGMKRYQIVILSFAIGIAFSTYLFSRMINSRNSEVADDIDASSLAVKIFFSSTNEDSQTLDCGHTYAVSREVSRLTAGRDSRLGEVTYLALKELLKGPTDAEKGDGFFTSINPETKIRKILIENNVATVDFSALGGSASGGDESIAGSCKVLAIRSQITETLRQFQEIKEVVISVNGETEGILQP